MNNALKFLIQSSIIISFIFCQVNTESMRNLINDPGIYHNMDLSFAYISGNSEIFIFNGKYQLDYFSPSKLHLLFVIKHNRSFEKSKDDFTNRGFSHLRITKPCKSIYFIENFIQKEFNYFINLKNRELLGLGIRLNPKNNLFLGLGAMNEIELYQEDNIENHFVKSTNYINYSLKIFDNITIKNIIYYQFKIKATEHYRILWDGNLNFHSSNWLSFNINCHYHYNISEIKTSYFEITKGLSFTF